MIVLIYIYMIAQYDIKAASVISLEKFQIRKKHSNLFKKLKVSKTKIQLYVNNGIVLEKRARIDLRFHSQ